MKHAYWALLAGLVLAPAVAHAAEMKAAPTGEDVVAVSLPMYEGPIAAGKQGVEEEAAALGVKLDVRSAQGSPELQLGQLEDFVARRVQGIIVAPVPRGAKAEKVATALRIILSDPNVKAVLFNIFGGITRGDEVARGIVDALKMVDARVPMVARIVGTNADAARKILAEGEMETAETLEEGAQKAIAMARTHPN